MSIMSILEPVPLCKLRNVELDENVITSEPCSLSRVGNWIKFSIQNTI